jgi:hypothetical protein
VRYLLPTVALVALALGGCATLHQKAGRLANLQGKKTEDDGTQKQDQLRRLAVEDGEVNSLRGASILYPDYGRAFDPNGFTPAARTYGAKKSQGKPYAGTKDVRVDTYQTRDFYDAKPNSQSDRKYATTKANTNGKYAIPNRDTAFGTKVAPSRESWFAHLLAPSREAGDAHRPYLGQESKKLRTAVPPKELAKWQNGESVNYGDGAVEKVSTLQPLSVDDIRELLNKSK